MRKGLLAMQKKDNTELQETLALIAIGFSVIITVSMTSGMFGPWEVLVGIVLLIFLYTYTSKDSRKKHSIIFALIWGFCILNIFGFIIDTIYILKIAPVIQNWSNIEKDLFDIGQPLSIKGICDLLVWVIASFIGWMIVKK